MIVPQHDGQQEEESWEQEAIHIERWWQSEFQKDIKRPYTAAEVVPLRSSLLTSRSFASNQQANKLRRILREHHRNGTAEMTFGMLDPIQASQMDGQDTIYISGALCAFATSDCIGQDTSDYPWDTVPKAAERIFQSQLYHDRRQKQHRMSCLPEERQALPIVDHLKPIVADADMGFGTTAATMKLVKSLVEAGVAMFHLDDLALGGKRYTGPEAGHTVVPTSEYIQRLTAARLQLDIMGAETMIMCRCDADGARFLTSNSDPRDHGHILGATKPTEPLSQSLKRGVGIGEWEEQAGASTFDEAVRMNASDAEMDLYLKLLSQRPVCSLDFRVEKSKQVLGKNTPFFDCELARTSDGRYLYQSSVSGILDRSLAAAPLGDATWGRMDLSWDKLSAFHLGFRKVYPDRLFAAGYGGTYNFAAKGYTEEDVKNFQLKLAQLGIVWQVQPAYAMQGLNFYTKRFSQLWAKEGIVGYIREIQTPAVGVDTDGYEKMSWSGGYLADAYTDIVGGKNGQI